MSHVLSRRHCKPNPGTKFSVGGTDYILAGSIGNGAVGLVRKAKRVPDGKLFAVKFLAPDPKYVEESVFEDVAARFKREGERGVKLDHHSLVKILAYVENVKGGAFAGGSPKNPFLLMEFVSGRTLESLVRSWASPPNTFEVTRERLFIAIQLAASVDHLHRRKLIHRDIKPANVFTSQAIDAHGLRALKVGDFGIMKWGDFNARLGSGVLTATSQRGLGTLKYMSPEQATRPRDVTSKSDMFSMGVTFYEIFTGTILAGPHHVFEIMNARLDRGTTISRYLALGYSIKGDDLPLAEHVMEMMRRGLSDRPSAEKTLGRFEREYEERFGLEWQLETKGPW